MKKASIIPVILMLLLGGTTNTSAIADKVQKENPVNKIMEMSEGEIVIDIPDNILKNILTDPTPQKKTTQTREALHKGINKIQGYRIQVFSDGRNPASLEARAKARGSAIVAKFPKYRGQVYSYSSSPNWFTRVGNFRSSGEATAALNELKRAFPAFAGEMRIVKSQIVVIK